MLVCRCAGCMCADVSACRYVDVNWVNTRRERESVSIYLSIYLYVCVRVYACMPWPLRRSSDQEPLFTPEVTHKTLQSLEVDESLP